MLLNATKIETFLTCSSCFMMVPSMKPVLFLALNSRMIEQL